MHDLHEDGVCFTLSRRNLQVAGFFAGEAPCISLEKQTASSERAGSLVLPNCYTPHGRLAGRLAGAAAEGSSRPCRGAAGGQRQRQRGPCPPASLLRRGSPRERGRAALPRSSRRRRRLLGPGWSPDGAAWSGCSGTSRAAAGLAGPEGDPELWRGWEALAGRRPPSSPAPDLRGRQRGRLRGADRRCPRASRRRRAPRLGQLRGPPSRVISPCPDEAPSPMWGGPICTARPAPGRGSRWGPAIPPPPHCWSSEERAPRPGKRRLLPAEPSREEQGSEERKSIFIGLAFFSLLAALLPNDIYLTAFDSS